METRIEYNGFQQGGPNGGFDLFTLFAHLKDRNGDDRWGSTLGRDTLLECGVTWEEMQVAKTRKLSGNPDLEAKARFDVECLAALSIRRNA